jgi:hypothetical protein
MTIAFFRNDDVRNRLDEELIQITDLFIHHNIPITHAVEPANVTPEVAAWLVDAKQRHPDLIEIMQHGYDHRIKNTRRKGEFGGDRTYDEQYQEIMRGKELMNLLFKDMWFECFNFPYAPYNPAAIRAVNAAGFKVLNSHYNHGITRRIFYALGHLLRRGYMMGHHVSWNLETYPNTNLFEIDMNISVIKRYINEISECEMLSLNELKEITRSYMSYPTIGILLHHRYHNTREKLSLINHYLTWCRSIDLEFSTIKGVYERFH